MEVRTTHSTVCFSSRFLIHGFDAAQPPGEYRVEFDEERVEGVTFVAWRRVAAYMEVPAIANRSLTRQMVPIDRADLEAALAKDGEAS